MGRRYDQEGERRRTRIVPPWYMDEMLNRLDWDDVHTFLVAMRSRSLPQVADELGISHLTAGRRVTAMEERLRLRLFHRRPDGLHRTPEADALLPHAEAVERSMRALERQSQALDP